jgi:autotransporter-associated beta strand protein
LVPEDPTSRYPKFAQPMKSSQVQRHPIASNKLLAAMAALAFAAAPAAYAASGSWLGATDSLWSEASNWSVSPVPGAGDTATFNDAGNANTTLDLGAGVTIGSVVFDTSSAAAYTIGSGLVGSQTLTFGTLNSGITLNSSVANNQLVNANVALSSTGNYNFTNNSTTNSLTIAGGISASTAGNKTLTLTGNGNTIISGAITNGSGAISTLIKTGTGTLTLSGANTYSGGTRANAGTTILSGTRPNQTGTGDWLSVNNVGAQNATLKIVSGADWGIHDFNIGEVTNSRAAVLQTGGTLAAANGVWVGNGATSYGYYSLSSGTLTNTGGDLAVGRANGATGVMDVSGGSVTTSSWIVLGRGQGAGTAGSGLLNVTGGSVTSNSNNIALNWAPGSGALSVLNVGGGAGAASVTGVSNAANYLDVSQVSSAGTAGVVNVRANGTLTVAQVRVSGANSTALFNFDGGTLKSTAANAGANFMNSGNMDAVTVYSGGGTIDNNSTNITIGNVLRAATGNGVTSIAVTDGGSGYIGAPMVKITGGTGNTATGYAVMVDDGTGNGTYKVDSIVVTSAGTYSVDPTTVTLTGGGASTAATIGSIATGANTSGGMNFTGSGTTTLSGVNTYTGPTTIFSGTVALAASGSIATSSGVAIAAGAIFNTSAQSFTMLGGQTVSFGLDGSGAGSAGFLQAGDLNIGSGSVSFSVTGGALDDDAYILASYTSVGGTAFGSVDNLPSGYTLDYNYLGGNQIALIAVPEPSTFAALAGLAGLAVVGARRRRRASV